MRRTRRPLVLALLALATVSSATGIARADSDPPGTKPADGKAQTTDELLRALIDEVKKLRTEKDVEIQKLRAEVENLKTQAGKSPAPSPSSGGLQIGPSGSSPVAATAPAVRTLTSPQTAGSASAGPTYRTAESQPTAVGRAQPLGIPLFGFAGAGSGGATRGLSTMHAGLVDDGMQPSTADQVTYDRYGLFADTNAVRKQAVDDYLVTYAAANPRSGPTGTSGSADWSQYKVEASEARARLSTASGLDYMRLTGQLPSYAHIPEVSRVGYLTSNGHSLSSVEWEAEGQDDLPRFFLESATLAPVYYGATEQGAVPGASNGQFAVVAPQGKFAVVGSSARNSDLRKLQTGRSNSFHKGFSTDAVLADNQFNVANVWGNVAAEYNPDPSLGDPEVRLRSVAGNYRVDKERFILTLGKGAVPFGLYSDTNWASSWVWLTGPVTEGRYLNGNLESTGASLFWRLQNQDDHDVFLTLGVYNASELAGFFEDEKHLFGGHKVDDGGRYDFGDFAYMGRVEWARDFHHGRCCLPFVAQIGASAICGPNGTGPEGSTSIVAAHARVFRMNDVSKSPSGFIWEIEAMRRELVADDNATQPRGFLLDEGVWTSLVYAFPRRQCSGVFGCGQWSLGAKYERATGDGGGVDSAGAPTSRNDDPYRDDRTRASAFLSWNPFDDCGKFLSHFKFACEWNWDDAEHLDHDEHTVILGVQVN